MTQAQAVRSRKKFQCPRCGNPAQRWASICRHFTEFHKWTHQMIDVWREAQPNPLLEKKEEPAAALPTHSVHVDGISFSLTVTDPDALKEAIDWARKRGGTVEKI